MENENKNNKVVYYVIGVVIVVVLILLVVLNMQTSNETITPNTDDETALESDLTAEDITKISEDTSEGSINVGASVSTISYADALIKYADKRIQFDTACQTFPNTVTYKDNTGIMLDNRSSISRTIKVGTNYTVKPWSFKIVVLPNIYLQSKTILVDCDKSQNVATILVQE
ncbi:MAG: hypothetical protein UR25_C0005G0042 [Candidatus Nomurabacteria bacterium GW2011_GWE1_32_28]|uniref:Uncharacterized protein n=1 Tax=Candidatus Nomurabacteria bacterium GW2011_GWF1_31_48 TaxID=1618767 RepID=A0A0F9YE96_9BACT|nr:MAG: hypothetical protein UR10_C0003G0240 [Candidatus Nomurabacteria bacterium GW2011_GWF2_30_133]KKP28459.1 MAG: hypothetical protein UR18_C0004G0041 [Candidatus Nomurabacteria bacterium GW2011_GWE2_31_40]KKP30039.1 MAG: hypothetical protein UR19_C0005G0041 [Candidatus Nomurabacteria bacterium GW2011_GWF1_31_48]KKP34558.1 MAG: hypothetical protein UR25_C0005G0042 [Candidatus Nomurabacteria bacterium GW2011_GWE1_32_28]HBP27443.1 hypothetical protein [Candidatus Nomurabacteria bacterium]